MPDPLTADDLARLRSRPGTATIPEVLALLDMVDGLQTLVRGLADAVREHPAADAAAIYIDPDLGVPGGWRVDDRNGSHPLVDARPDLAALLDLALTPQSDAPLPGDHP